MTSLGFVPVGNVLLLMFMVKLVGELGAIVGYFVGDVCIFHPDAAALAAD